MSSITQRSKSRAEVDCVPAAEAVWINEADVEMQMELAEPLLVDETNVTGASPGGDKNSTARKDDDGAHNEPFSVTNQQTQQCWGRFDCPQVEAAYTDEHAIATARPDDRHARLLFIRKVYTILSAQLLATFGVCAFLAMNETAKTFVVSSPNFYVLNVVVSLGSLLAMLVFKRMYPTNFILLSIFTFSMASMVGTVTAFYAEAGASGLVLEAVAITASVFIMLTIFTLQSKWDFSFMGAGLGMCLWVMVLWGFFGIIFGLRTGYVYALAGSILFSGYIIYDTYMICERLDPEDYIVAAIELYLDLLNLFLYILRLMNEMNRRR